MKNRISAPEIWGGIEATINRVGDTFNDQLRSGDVYTRETLIPELARSGISALRFPVLWEKHEPVEGCCIDWSWSGKQLNILEEKKIKPIVGLLHHGSGPAFTNLSDAGFPRKLAAYAEKVAQRFPWIEYYTPVNEPLTTARFSGLYGLWYPHKSDDRSFLQMLINQLKAVVLCMEAIRKINPDAKLVQTEDLAKCFGSSELQYQVDFENQRRWLTYDLLCGRVDWSHKLYNYFIKHGISKEDLRFFIQHPCVPDVCGFNYYVTSERFLDADIDRYPSCMHGGNGRHRYVDVEAVRVQPLQGIKQLLSEAAQQVQAPLAVTEVHLGCTREEQLRWLKETYDSCCELRAEGTDIRAVTVWSMLGSFDWDSLLTRRRLNYESGCYDIRNGKTRKTAIGKMVHAIAANQPFHHPVLEEKGWWHREHVGTQGVRNDAHTPLLIIGKSGTLAQAFARLCAARGLHFVSLSREDIDINNEQDVAAVLRRYRPWAVVNTSGYVNVDAAETDAENCYRINTYGAATLARVAGEHDARYVSFSSDLVFSGQKKDPYTETDAVHPLNVYGNSKAAGETLVSRENADSLVIRTSAFFGPWDQYNFATQVLQKLQRNDCCPVIAEGTVSPTYVPDLVHTSLDLLIDGEKGVWHVSNEGGISWSDFAREIAFRGGHKSDGLTFCTAEDMNLKAARPLYSALKSDKGIVLPKLEDAIERYFKEKIA
ncbi:sugar nucleotide-binding protein [Sediminibacterium roseum]|uniref:dTDP-4-dehydrorhamnose reductase n=1 Tax=Sediminibacterium roseum TaxID=1978412 RepID=A0ABW9ZSV2_9BACT|nr:family 1 glycosylhydrolase [Sediminibacterium roseum]NCI50191.1 sugar nucleotide-binding protein [Sediminibacterium roseum]